MTMPAKGTVAPKIHKLRCHNSVTIPVAVAK